MSAKSRRGRAVTLLLKVWHMLEPGDLGPAKWEDLRALIRELKDTSS